MTWRYIDNVPVEEVAEFMYLVLSAAVDGMEGVPKEELERDLRNSAGAKRPGDLNDGKRKRHQQRVNPKARRNR